MWMDMIVLVAALLPLLLRRPPEVARVAVVEPPAWPEELPRR
jgi:hypothetical protein